MSLRAVHKEIYKTLQWQWPQRSSQFLNRFHIALPLEFNLNVQTSIPSLWNASSPPPGGGGGQIWRNCGRPYHSCQLGSWRRLYWNQLKGSYPCLKGPAFNSSVRPVTRVFFFMREFPVNWTLPYTSFPQPPPRAVASLPARERRGERLEAIDARGIMGWKKRRPNLQLFSVPPSL